MGRNKPRLSCFPDFFVPFLVACGYVLLVILRFRRDPKTKYGKFCRKCVAMYCFFPDVVHGRWEHCVPADKVHDEPSTCTCKNQANMLGVL